VSHRARPDPPDETPPLVLASGSPRRRQLLEQIGLRFDVEPAEADESVLPGEEAVAHVRRLALDKARVVAARRPDAIVMAGDTVVVLDGEIMAKPGDRADAVAMLLRLQGRTHRVETGVAVVAPVGREAAEVVGADVHFRPFDRAFAEAYVATGEPMDKAGAYGIQGYGALLVDRVDGDFFAVVGFPVARVVGMLGTMGWEYRFGGEKGGESRQTTPKPGKRK
jgi:septum formation protein